MMNKEPKYKRLMDNFNTLSYEIGSLRKGKKVNKREH